MKRLKREKCLFLIFLGVVVAAQKRAAWSSDFLLPPDRSAKRLLPTDGTELSNDTIYQKKYNDLKQQNVENQKQIRAMQEQTEDYRVRMQNFRHEMISQGEGAPRKSSEPQSPVASPPASTSGAYPPPYGEVYQGNAGSQGAPSTTVQSVPVPPKQASETHGAQFFAVSSGSSPLGTASFRSTKETVIPGGSFVKAKVISGVEATSKDEFPVLLQLDYAYQGPNHRTVNFKNCLLTAKASANLSIERVIMQLDKLSCVRENGEAFQIKVNGFISGADSSFGAKGTYISHQDKVFLAALLDSLVKGAGGIGQALSQSQQTQTVAPGGTGSAATATNVTGNIPAFVAGSALNAAAGPAGMVTQFYLNEAIKLFPTIGIGSGQDVWAVILDQVSVPSLFTDTNYDNTVPY